MLKGIGSFIGMALLLLAAGCMAGYIYGGGAVVNISGACQGSECLLVGLRGFVLAGHRVPYCLQ